MLCCLCSRTKRQQGPLPASSPSLQSAATAQGSRTTTHHPNQNRLQHTPHKACQGPHVCCQTHEHTALLGCACLLQCCSLIQHLLWLPGCLVCTTKHTSCWDDSTRMRWVHGSTQNDTGTGSMLHTHCTCTRTGGAQPACTPSAVLPMLAMQPAAALNQAWQALQVCLLQGASGMLHSSTHAWQQQHGQATC
ncbi:hypothetical protein COO60DRAFT_84352 [Scenedesmus sp. NREL 46B-D3]|nr:hypothetical protein COO60DRAFT_84352 [Scenedesmus sp. NREL 46B-D3]